MNTSDMSQMVLKYLPFFIPIAVIQLSLQIYSIVNLIRRKTVRYGNKLIWGIAILVLGLVGPICYLLLRGEEME